MPPELIKGKITNNCNKQVVIITMNNVFRFLMLYKSIKNKMGAKTMDCGLVFNAKKYNKVPIMGFFKPTNMARKLNATKILSICPHTILLKT